MLKYLFILLLLISAEQNVTLAQTAESVTTVQATTEAGNPEVAMADTLRRDGKIYVVVAVIITVLAGLILYLIRLDRKVARLEQQYRS
ncbi:CcmD family protein [Adhaeribacter radiodurans]|nr:hypothetical protein [Adhaeribacter radiodurans]